MARAPFARGRTARTSSEKSAAQTRRNRRRFARRAWARRWLTWRYVVSALVVLAVLGGGVYAVYFSSALSVQGTQVEGAGLLRESELLAAADVPTGGPLATVDLRAIERRVSQRQEVKSVDVSRKWPHDVLIEVTERTPVAVLDRNGVARVVDDDGVTFPPHGLALKGLPHIRTDATDPDALKEAATVAAALPPEIAKRVDHVELESADAVNLELRDGRAVRWGSSEASDRKAEVLLALLSRPADVYDVSVPAQPTIR